MIFFNDFINIRNLKFLNCWLQCKLNQCENIVFGIKNDNNIVNELRWVDRDSLIYYNHETVSFFVIENKFLNFFIRVFVFYLIFKGMEAIRMLEYSLLYIE